MDLSPSDIRNYEFPNQMRGYDKDEVDNFLEQVAAAMEAVKQENLKLSMEVDSLKSQVTGLRQYEDAIKNAAIDARRNADATISKAKEDATAYLEDAKKKADLMIGSREERAETLENQLRQLEMTRKSYIDRLRNLVESHLDIVKEISEQDFPQVPKMPDLPDLPEVPDTPEFSDQSAPATPTATPNPEQQPRDEFEITDSSEISGDRKEALHQGPSKQQPVAPEEANAPAPKTGKPVSTDDVDGLDPELAAALQSYQAEYAAKQTDETADEDQTIPPTPSDNVPQERQGSPQPQPAPTQTQESTPAPEDQPKPQGWQETNRVAEDVPPGFVPGPSADAPAPAESTDDFDEEEPVEEQQTVAADSQDQPTEHNTIEMEENNKMQDSQGNDIAKELDEVVAKFEEEMDKAEKGR